MSNSLRLPTVTGLNRIDDAIILHHQVVNLEKPHSGQLESLRLWMDRPSMGNMNLIGDDHSVWKDSKLDELITMARNTPDGATAATSTRLVKLYHSIIGRHIHVSSRTLDCLDGP